MSRFSTSALIRRAGGIYLLLALALFTLVIFGDLISMVLSPGGIMPAMELLRSSLTTTFEVTAITALVCWCAVGYFYAASLTFHPRPTRILSFVQLGLFLLVMTLLVIAAEKGGGTASESSTSSDEPILGVLGFALLLAPIVVPLIDLLLPPYRRKTAVVGEVFA